MANILPDTTPMPHSHLLIATIIYPCYELRVYSVEPDELFKVLGEIWVNGHESFTLRRFAKDTDNLKAWCESVMVCK